MGYLDCEHITKYYGRSRIIDRLDLSVEEGEFLSLLGPSGCGKSTLLRIICGLTQCNKGRVIAGGVDVTRVPAHRRNIGVVFQTYALFPHLSVEENVAFGLRTKGFPRSEIASTVRRSLDMVQMTSFADRSTMALSGGQQQRVAVARALALKPRLLLLDEPFSALDRKLRETMQIELRRLLRDLGITVIFVTHDQDEAFVMSERIAVMNHGVIEQLDTPYNIYAHPTTEFASTFVGRSCRLTGKIASVNDGHVTVATAFGVLAAKGDYPEGANVIVSVRPENVLLTREQGAEPGMNTISANLNDAVFIGGKKLVHFRADGDDHLAIETGGYTELPPAGSELVLTWKVDDTHLFPKPTA